MKKAILIGLVVGSAQVCAQGTLSLNTATGNKPRIQVFGVNVVPQDNVWVQVLVAGASSLSGPGAEPFPMTLSGANAGLFSKGTLTVNGKPPGSAVDVTIRAWDKDSGQTYDQSLFRTSATLRGFVLGGVVDANGIASLPASIVPAFTGFTLTDTPEPTAYGLTLSGLVLVVWQCRKTRPG